MDSHNFVENISAELIEEYYNMYLNNNGDLSLDWKNFFIGYEFGLKDYAKNNKNKNNQISDEFKVLKLIDAYRERGHYFTKTNPVRTPRVFTPNLGIDNFDLTAKELSKLYEAGAFVGIGKSKLSDIILHLEQTYCTTFGVEYMYIRNTDIVEWLRERMESTGNVPNISGNEKLEILEDLYKAVKFEKFLHMKFPGHKRFSLEGCESLIPALNKVINKGLEYGVSDIIIGMSHRGRLNVMANVFGKSYIDIFSDFYGNEYKDETVVGDVKYHLGYSTVIDKDDHLLNLYLMPNPSHLETVSCVVEGFARGRIDNFNDGDNSKVVPIIIHGDAAISGQGIVYEVIQMSELAGYKNGGTIHIVINNQIGFTTNYIDGRSSVYCTDVGKIIQSPIFHVNGDDVEEIIYTIGLAMEYRRIFKKDVFIDLLCYRKYGHNEGDEPRYTQPLLYKAISNHPDTYTIYKEKISALINSNLDKINGIENAFNLLLEESKDKSEQIERQDIKPFIKHLDSELKEKHLDSLTIAELKEIAKRITTLPKGKKFLPKSEKLFEERQAMVEKDTGIDWGMAENMAYATILKSGINIRISGQDVERGTFSHRHSVVMVEDSEEKYYPLRYEKEGKGRFEIYNSLLSEYAVLGFEYGYSLSSLDNLVIWEAQYGDFGNGAQIIIDQYITSAFEKWRLNNNLVLLLPHGYEGQGSEHSSARIERFLSLSENNNVRICNCTIPSNYYHLLRLQSSEHKGIPLIVFTPKSLLRHSSCVSKLIEFTGYKFKKVIDDSDAEANIVEKIAICSGKVFYDIKAKQKTLNINTVAVIRLEQLSPFPEEELKNIIVKYKFAKEIVWVQEEPANMGCYEFIKNKIPSNNIMLIARPGSASPAVGSSKLHNRQQAKITDKLFEKCDCENVCKECRMLCETK
ncbi:MAG: 2-oxoglutarate dehydrogenase E1 component [Bacteroidetes bacterium GWE2_29_8]|nr:MAG: 2-oxoglutarate dehydrogenase E1 component [Bacteroidetes bacterium GWE2_29_8]